MQILLPEPGEKLYSLSGPELVCLGFLSSPHVPVQCLKAETIQGYETNYHLLTPSLCDC